MSENKPSESKDLKFDPKLVNRNCKHDKDCTCIYSMYLLTDTEEVTKLRSLRRKISIANNRRHSLKDAIWKEKDDSEKENLQLELNSCEILIKKFESKLDDILLNKIKNVLNIPSGKESPGDKRAKSILRDELYNLVQLKVDDLDKIDKAGLSEYFIGLT